MANKCTNQTHKWMATVIDLSSKAASRQSVALPYRRPGIGGAGKQLSIARVPTLPLNMLTSVRMLQLSTKVTGLQHARNNARQFAARQIELVTGWAE